MLLCLEKDEACRKLAAVRAAGGVECTLRNHRTYLNLTGPDYVTHVFILPPRGVTPRAVPGTTCAALATAARS